MARRKVDEERETSLARAEAEGLVEVVRAEGAARFVTFDEGWKWAEEMEPPPMEDGHSPLFVRLRPPSSVEESRVERVRKHLVSAGCSVVVERARRGAVVSASAEVSSERPHARVREVVLALVEESRSADKEKLRAMVEATMSQEGV